MDIYQTILVGMTHLETQMNTNMVSFAVEWVSFSQWNGFLQHFLFVASHDLPILRLNDAVLPFFMSQMV